MDGDDGAGPASTEPTDTRVFVGGVPDGVGTAELSARFGRYGEVRGCKVVVHADGKANRFGYLDMKLSHAALLRMQATYVSRTTPTPVPPGLSALPDCCSRFCVGLWPPGLTRLAQPPLHPH